MVNIGPMEVVLLLTLALTYAIPLMALIDALRVPSDSDYRTGTKLIWVLVIMHCLGAALYYGLGKPRAGARN